MAQEATIKINLEEGNADATLKDLKNDVKAVGTEAGKTNDKFKQGTDATAKSTVSLKTQLKNLKDEMVQLDHNSPEFKQMAMDAGAMEDKIKDVDAQVRILSSDTKGLDALVGAGQAIGGAFQASQGAMALFGKENEQVQKAIQNVIAVQGIMNGVMAVSNAIRKESVVGQKLLFFWSKIVTGAQWLWNIALSANPIGLIVLAITAMVVGVILLKDVIMDNMESIKKWTRILLLMLNPIGMIILAMEYLNDKEAEIEDDRVERTKAEKSRHAERINQIKREQKAFEKAEKEKQSQFDREIKRAKAEGKSVFALELQKLESIKNVQEKQLESYNLILEAGIEHYKNQAKINGLSEEEFIAQAQKQGVDLLAIQQLAIDGQQKYKDAIFDAESDILALKRDHREKNNKEDSKASDTKNKQADKDAQAEKKRLAQIDKDKNIANKKALDEYNKFLEDKANLEGEHIDSFKSAQQLEEEAVAIKYENLLEQARKFGEDTKLLEESQDRELGEIKAQYAQEALERKRAQILEDAELVASKAESVLNVLGDLQTIANTKEISRIKAKQKAGERLSQAEKKRLINDEKIKRGIAIAEIAIDTARGIAKAVAAGAGLVFPANIPAIASGVASVLAGVASATKVLNAPLPSFDSGSGSDVAGSLGGNAQESAPSINTNTNGSTILNEEPTQVYVLESDITNTQGNVQSIVEQATI